MKKVLKFAFIAGLYFCGQAFGHDVPVHRTITANAASAAYNYSSGFSDFINIISSDKILLNNATNSLVNGSAHEDDPVGLFPTDIGGYRSLNHFYDPLDTHYNKGLSDSIIFAGPGPIGDERKVIGTNSFAWASISNCTGIGLSYYPNIRSRSHPTNTWSWQNARYFEWFGLTETNQSDRQSNLDNMFRAVGQVMHLLEDTSQPQHVRNEQHLDKFPQWRSPIEDYGLLNISQLNFGDGSMLNWQAAGFTNLEDFWDTHKYNGDSSKLTAAESGGANTLGLAEWDNGNFLGDRHQYAEYYTTNTDIRYYSYPRRSGTITPSIDSITIKNGKVISRYYLKKDKDGVSVTHHSALTLWGMEHPTILKAKSTTIRDDNVLKDYHDQIIPKAVKYSAGLLDYFFRGTLGVSVTNSTITIRNTSGQDYNGGSFYLYKDDTNGTRTNVDQFDMSGITLPSLGSITETENDLNSATPSTKYILVYKGTIGVNGSAQPLDSVDAGIGIAVQTFTPQSSGNSCDGGPVNIQGFHWEVYSNFNNGTFSSSGTACSFSKVGQLVEVAYLSNPSDCEVTMTISARFMWESGSEPAFKLGFDPSYLDNTWLYTLPYAGSDNPQFSIVLPANSVTAVYLSFIANGGFSGTLSFSY